MTHDNDTYIPRYLQERPRDRLGLLKLIGIAAGTTISVNLLLTGVADAAIGVKDNAPSSDLALSQRVGNTLGGLIGGAFNVTCEDTASRPEDNPANGTGDWRVYGYVASYRVPLTHMGVMGSRIHLDNTVCASVDSIHYDAQHNPTPALSYPQLHGLLVGVHESEHVKGTEDEAITECTALQRVAGSLAARHYELSDPIMKSQMAARELALPARYRNVECRVGGALDNTPGDAPSDAWLPVR